MKTISRYIMTLALLLTAVTGAKAETVTWTASDMTDLSIDFHVGSAAHNTIKSITVTASGGGMGVWQANNISMDEGSATITFTSSVGNIKSIAITAQSIYSYGDTPSGWTLSDDYRKLSWSGDASPTVSMTLSDWSEFSNISEIVFTIESSPAPAADPDAIDVTTDAAEEGATFTEASFLMPTNDVDVNYELVRDMSYKVAFSGVPTRARLAKDGNGKFYFADGLTFQLLDNIDAANPKDITSAEGITFMVGEVEAFDFEGHIFYQLNKETLVPLDDFLADAHLGNYAICAVASTGEYDGSFSSGMITLFQGYEVTVPAKEFITYYKDEPLRVEDEAAELYTVSSVNGDKAVLSQKSDAMPSHTPMLVYNNSDETKVILLIPCNEPDLAITVAPEFIGTLEAATIAGSSDNLTNYALNGKQFVFVKNDISIAANKAWLSFETFNNAKQRSISIVFEEGTTGLEAIDNGQLTIDNDTWYDLNGRKLDGEPTTKGVFIKNGKKVMK